MTPKTLRTFTLLFFSFLVFSINSVGQSRLTFVPATIKFFPNARPPGIPADKLLHGQFIAVLLVNKNGVVTHVEEIIGPDWICPEISDPDIDLLRNAARSIAEKTTFIPATESGKPVGTRLQLTFHFASPKTTNSNESDKEFSAVAFGDAPSRASDDADAIKGGVVNGHALKLAKPKFPEAAQAVRLFGLVEVQVLILENGAVYSAEPKTGDPVFWSESRLAACKSKFGPTLLAGHPVKVSGIITYNFAP